ncbi:hypothetical protein JKP88DRAFT_223383 [Tribonema minus]|uniref:Ubiquitin-like protease family profile domain-containing protein n=1 Tax=Tribonema minus TaxID=303371 RepID=A0A836CDU6_9STRA|nr:hypothetical protein JKP88DRAFT_223383 [Tribonema minus]
MPYRWAEPLPPFVTCLNQPAPLRLLRSPSSGGLVATDGVLRGALYGDSVDDESWLTSSFIDMVLAQFAACYRGAHFMPIEFAAFRLARMGRADMAACTDILGQTIDYAARKPIIFLANVKNLHWNLLRVQHFPVPELQLFEPLGKPAKRAHGAHSSEGVSYRYIPKDVFVWLDTMCARGGGWATRSVSAITRQQQTTGFDCGVASLLYAEKCGQDQMREDIDAATTQDDITAYRQVLQKFLRSLAAQSGGGDGADGGAATALPSPSSPAAAAAAGADFLPPLSSPPLRSGATAAAAAVDTIDLVDDSAVQLQMPPHAGSSGASAAGAAAAGSGSSGSSSVIA